ncbi:MAG: sel1 repeat family protein [Magnetococcales bacterium]|nr:sel1 repeat family protein [Magnetococcales bacterium]
MRANFRRIIKYIITFRIFISITVTSYAFMHFAYLHYTAKNGNVSSQIKLAEWYSEGDFIKPDQKESERWYREASRQGDPEAMYQIFLVTVQPSNGSRQALT